MYSFRIILWLAAVDPRSRDDKRDQKSLFGLIAVVKYKLPKSLRNTFSHMDVVRKILKIWKFEEAQYAYTM